MDKKKGADHSVRKSGQRIVDIARELGISAATVSRALNDHPRISDKTKERVREKALELSYVVNRMASSLRNNRSGIIGLIVPRISMYFHTVFITALQNQLQSAGYRLMVAQSNDDVGLERDLVEAMFSSRVDALVVALALYSSDYGIFNAFIDQHIPLVFYDRVPMTPFPGAYNVVGDDFAGGYEVANHLVATGARKPAYISGPLSCNIYRDRTAGFLHGLQQHSVVLREEWVFHQELSFRNALKSLKILFATDDCPDAVFAANDNTAIATLKYAQKYGIDIPAKLKVIGYSNDPRAAIIRPAITTIDQYPVEMAGKVGGLLVQLLREGPNSVSADDPFVNPIKLLIRQTT